MTDKTCAACRHYQSNPYMAQSCGSPRASDAARLVVDRNDAVGIQAIFVRYNEMLCGIEGKWWEAKTA